jgi:hypothetical protein
MLPGIEPGDLMKKKTEKKKLVLAKQSSLDPLALRDVMASEDHTLPPTPGPDGLPSDPIP